jgi:hypothetical protein
VGAALVALDPPDAKAAFAAVQLARRTGDRWRDVSDEARAEVAGWLGTPRGTGPSRRVGREGGTLREEEQRDVMGESLPRGLRIE